MSAPRDSMSPSTPHFRRRRIARACESCRLRKTKCDGGRPCGKCKASNIICTSWHSKKTKEKIYAKGYVDILERRQAQLIAGLEETYHRLVAGRLWPGQELPEKSGHPLVHDILSALQVLEIKNDDNDSGSDEHEIEEPTSSKQDLTSQAGTRRPSASPALCDWESDLVPQQMVPHWTIDMPAAYVPPQSTPSSSRTSISSFSSAIDINEIPTSQTSFQSESAILSSPTSMSLQTWPSNATSAEESVIIPANLDLSSNWSGSFSSDLTGMTMDMNFNLSNDFNGKADMGQQHARSESVSQWWTPESMTPDWFPPCVQSTSGMDELSNLLYRDLCADSYATETSQQDFRQSLQQSGNHEIRF